jgi:hypothetical protein
MRYHNPIHPTSPYHTIPPYHTIVPTTSYLHHHCCHYHYQPRRVPATGTVFGQLSFPSVLLRMLLPSITTMTQRISLPLMLITIMVLVYRNVVNVSLVMKLV